MSTVISPDDCKEFLGSVSVSQLRWARSQVDWVTSSPDEMPESATEKPRHLQNVYLTPT